MKRYIPVAALAALFIAPLAWAQAQPAPQMSMKKPPPVSKFLSADELRPEMTLPAPPPDGSPAARAELAELRRIEKARTPGEFARAAKDADDATENVTAFSGVMGPGFQLDRLPATAKLFADLRHEDSAAAKRGKAYFQRTRPWVVDPSLHACPHGDDTAKSSYPSGHATMAYATAGILVRLEPSKAQAILARAADYSENRLVCGAHFRRDIVAGQALGTVLAAELMDKPAFRAEFDAARAELAAAHVVD
jgi:acid phosphatase (class A)